MSLHFYPCVRPHQRVGQSVQVSIRLCFYRTFPEVEINGIDGTDGLTCDRFSFLHHIVDFLQCITGLFFYNRYGCRTLYNDRSRRGGNGLFLEHAKRNPQGSLHFESGEIPVAFQLIRR